MQIGIIGNIGAGKTTLARMLSQEKGWHVKYEAVDNNPYLVDFYNEPERWGFNMQIFLMNKKIQDILSIKKDEVVIMDRTLFEDRYMFVPTLLEQGYLSARDFNTYDDLYTSMSKLISNPDLIIYIRSSIGNLVSQIEKRGRGCESTISIDYLKKLNNRYEEFASMYSGKIPILIIDGDTEKFETDQDAFVRILNAIDYEISKNK